MRKNKRGYYNNYNKNRNIYFIIAIVCIFFSKPCVSMAKVIGKCDNCHTMHNSQDGEVDPNGPPIPSLLSNDCIGCHSSDASSLYYDLGGSLVPVVNYTGPEEPTNTLAGGNFWWLKNGDDSKGHNVFPGEDGADAVLTYAPGGFPPEYYEIDCGSNTCHVNLNEAYDDNGGNEPGLEGRQGCTGCHMVDDNRQNGFHHANDGDPNTLQPVVDFPWYRFLKGHATTNLYGVKGIEDPDWQATKSSSDHNEYLGKPRPGGNTRRLKLIEYTMTAFCGGCHKNFHVQQEVGDGPWIRHPSDSILPSDKEEYTKYNTFDPMVPVARQTLTTVSSSVKSGEDGDLVMCLSCHQPHASPFPDILRWNYDDMRVGSGNTNGCFICHTQKN